MTAFHRTRTPWTLLAPALAGLAGLALATSCSDAPTTPPGATPSADARQGLNGDAPRYQFDRIDVPGSIYTVPEGISANGAVAGFYATPDGYEHGFVLKGGTFSTIDYQDAQGVKADYTEVNGIAEDGEVVGVFFGANEEGAAAHGFRMNQWGQFSLVRAEGFVYEIVQRILPDGTMLGCGHDHNGAHMYAVSITSGRTTVDTLPVSMANGGAHGGGLVVGLYRNANHREAYVRDRGTLTSFMVPGSKMTAAWDVNERGDIVGNTKIGGADSGFVRTGNSRITTLAYPGAVGTYAFGVNARGDIVGYYSTADGSVYGFIARRIE